MVKLKEGEIYKSCYNLVITRVLTYLKQGFLNVEVILEPLRLNNKLHR